MSKLIERDINGEVSFVSSLCVAFLNSVTEDKDTLLLEMLGELSFDCGHTRWDSPIEWTHISSGKIKVRVYLPQLCDFWDGCPHHTNPSVNDVGAFVSSCGYEVSISDKKALQVPYEDEGLHWLKLPLKIREAWEIFLEEEKSG